MFQPWVVTFPAAIDMEQKIGAIHFGNAYFSGMFPKESYFPATAPALENTICTKIQISTHSEGLIIITPKKENH